MASSDGTETSTTTATEEVSLSAVQLKSTYATSFKQDARISDILRVLDAIIARDSEEDLTTSDLMSAIVALKDLIAVNTEEIQYLHKLNGLLILELTEQGINIESEELTNELNYIQ